MFPVQQALDPIGLINAPTVTSVTALKVKAIYDEYCTTFCLVGALQQDRLYVDLKNKINDLVCKDVLLRLVIFYETPVMPCFLDFWRFLEGRANVAGNRGLIGVYEHVGTEQFIEVVKKAISKSEQSRSITDEEYKLHRIKLIRNIHNAYLEAFAKFKNNQKTLHELQTEFRMLKIELSAQLTPEEGGKFARICKIPSSTLDCLNYLDGTPFLKPNPKLHFLDTQSIKEMVDNLIQAIN